MRPLLLDETYVLGLMGNFILGVGLLVALVLFYTLLKVLQPSTSSTGKPHRSPFSIGCGIVLGILLLLVLLFLAPFLG
ncbi:hypothetical protein [Hymenobacter cellulosilyticus]|uniref:Uncharacterized protein n=1 Tax=Hymenobacter cellulosilyticus TaxID=2932248 RepID=A0A8T9Q1U2_9BACT|nr:hypothetical protein [Hymenobacter cellulosilyticus]UOQ70411.1 hypothetical protein MUN79_16890 [Hymenobacter cellulosilyticus]